MSRAVCGSTAQDTWDELLCEINEDGDRSWYDETGKPHRENGPAVIRQNGAQVWYKHGKRHREDGPAYIGPAGHTRYWVNGEEMTEKEFNARKLTING